MIYNDEWTEGLNQKQQRTIIDYVLNEGQVSDEMKEYYSVTTIKKFLESEKGRKALHKYVEYKFDVKKPIVKMQLMKIHFYRAFFNPGDIITPEGAFIKKIKSLKQLGPLAYCIEGIETKIIGYEKKTDKPIKEIKIKLCDRNKSLEIIKQLYKIGEEDEDTDLDEKSVFEMSDEEREDEIKRLIGGDPKLIEFVKGGKEE